MNPVKIKLLYHNDGRLLYSNMFPEVPPVMASANADQLAMNAYERRMKEAVRYGVEVLNPDKAFTLIAFNEPLERDKIYCIECSFLFKGGKIEIL